MPPIFLSPGASERELLVQLLQLVDANHTTVLERLITMSQTITDEVAAETLLSAKVDLLLAAFAAGRSQVADLITQTSALAAQIADLRANGVLTETDAAALTSATADMAAKAAAIDAALTPPPATP